MRQTIITLAVGSCLLLSGWAGATAVPGNGVQGDDQRVADGYEFLGQLQPDRAIACFTGPYIEALAAGDRQKAARYLTLIAMGFRFDENHEACLACCRLASQLDGQSLSAQALQADTLTRMRRLADADAYFKHLLPLATSNELVARAAANLAAAHMDIEQANKYLQIATTLDPQDWRVHEYMARLDYDNAVSDHLARAAAYAPTPYAKEMLLWKEELRRHPDAPKQDHLDKAAQLLPNEPSWRIALALRRAQSGDEKGSFKLMSEAVQCPRLFGRAFSQFALFSAFHNQPQDAAAALNYLKKVQPNSPELYVVTAQVATRAGDLKAAEAAWRKSLELNPCQNAAWTGLAALPRYQTDLAAQDELAKQWLTSFPHDPLGQIFQGSLYRHRRQWALARPYYTQARQLLDYMTNRRQERQSQWLMITSGDGTCSYKLGEQGALQCAIGFNQLKPDDPSLVKVRPGKINLSALQGNAKTAAEHGLLADMLFETGELDDCVKEYQAALALENNSVWHNGLLKAYIDKRDFASASKEDLIVANHALTNDIPKAADKLKKTIFHEQ